MPAPLCIFCEGPSEVRYLNAWNALLRDTDVPLVLVPKPMNGGVLVHVREVLNAFFRENKRAHCLVWADSDLYHRNDGGCADTLREIYTGLPDFEFSVHNFEDFVAAHLDDASFARWQEVFADHLAMPLHSRDYNPLYQQVLRGYSKGVLPVPHTIISYDALVRVKKRLPLLQPPNIPDGMPQYPLFAKRFIAEIENAASLLIEDLAAAWPPLPIDILPKRRKRGRRPVLHA